MFYLSIFLFSQKTCGKDSKEMTKTIAVEGKEWFSGEASSR